MVKLPKLPSDPADDYIKQLLKIFTCFRAEHNLQDFDVNLGLLLEDVKETGDNLVILRFAKKFAAELKQLIDEIRELPDKIKDQSLAKQTDNLLDILEKYGTDLTEIIDKIKGVQQSAVVKKLKQAQELHVENWDPSGKDLEEFQSLISNYQKRRLSKKTLKDVMKFLHKQAFNENFDILKRHKNGGLLLEEGESREEIFERIEHNLMNVPQPVPDAILSVLILSIIGILQAKKRISKDILSRAKISRHEKGQPLLITYYNEYNKTKKHGYLFMLQACLRYLTREWSSKQRTLIRTRLGVDSHWSSKFTWDYFTAFKKIEGVQKPNWENMFGDAEWYSSPEKLEEEIDNVIEELIYCIKKEYIKFDFLYYVTLKKDVRMLLEIRLEEERQKMGKIEAKNKQIKKETMALSIFLNDKYEAYRENLIEYHKSFKKEDLLHVLQELETEIDDPFDKIKHLVRYKNNEWYMKNPESVKLEYKSNFYLTPEILDESWENYVIQQKKKWSKKIPKELNKKEQKKWLDERIGTAESFMTRTQKERVKSLRKSVCAFLNTDGGRMFFGVPDDIKKPIFGLEKDHRNEKFVKLNDDQFFDKYTLHVRDLIKGLNSDFKKYRDYIDVEPIRLPKKPFFILMIEVRKVPGRNVQFTHVDERKYYAIRDGNTSKIMYDTNDYLSWRDHKMKTSD